MPYIEVPIEGSGDGPLSRGGDPYRARMNGVPGSAVIPTDKDGKPTQTTAIVWVDPKNDTEVDRSIRRIPDTEARGLLRQLDPKVDPDTVEQKRGIRTASNG